jgi:hypothetical protein
MGAFELINSTISFIMKNSFLLMLCAGLLSLSHTAIAQHAGFGIGLDAGDGSHAVVPDNSDFDIQQAISIEVWFRSTDNVMDDQKLVGKSGTIFPLNSSYTLGYIDGQGVFELWDSEGDGILCKGGSVTQGAWVHLVGTFDLASQTLRIYINGVMVDETINANIGPSMGYVTQPLIIGGAPWFPESKNVDGNIDEVRIWGVALDEATINEWMHQDLDATHPNWDDLTMYHKYNEGTGSAAVDVSGNGHDADLSLVSSWISSDAPFKGDYNLLSSTPVGVWQGHPSATSSILTLTNSGITGISSVLFANNDVGLSVFLNDGPSGYTTAMGRVWVTTVQGAGDNFTVEADLTDLDLNMISGAVLVGTDPSGGFANGTVFPGTVSGNTFTATGVTFEEGWFYTLAFNTDPSSTAELAEAASMEIFPNPNRGVFQVRIDQEGTVDAVVEVIDQQGKLVHQEGVVLMNTTHLDMQLSNLASGMYTVRVLSEGKSTVQRLVIE